ncbi:MULTISPECIES: SHOCT domain-containing protein [unclassified Microbacterium]|uniref:SHOCT domain-containing protein n=1 Tax=unclassified Microbacterium TaxID=2609290 RepID=UPI00214CFE0B|nr:MULTISPECIES: SHOCT domain-containing protein [unclassified Microbacterium]MCR2785067.1 SHOCT domain-containing protein [Microbacterium sp. zg.B96]WIM16601.1 SHOCT domain-containing protein [Microbacterium sp. zg-B96]
MGVWDFLAGAFWFYIWISCVWIVITIIVDVFRDPELGGGAKALWVIFLVFVPLLGALVYIIARGHRMGERRSGVQGYDSRTDADAYIRDTTGGSPAAEIQSAKTLLDSGAISQAEFDSLKSRALSVS